MTENSASSGTCILSRDCLLGAPLTISAVTTSRAGVSATSVSGLEDVAGMVGSLAVGVLYGRDATRTDLPTACLETACWQARRRDMMRVSERKATAGDEQNLDDGAERTRDEPVRTEGALCGRWGQEWNTWRRARSRSGERMDHRGNALRTETGPFAVSRQPPCLLPWLRPPRLGRLSC